MKGNCSCQPRSFFSNARYFLSYLTILVTINQAFASLGNQLSNSDHNLLPNADPNQLSVVPDCMQDIAKLCPQRSSIGITNLDALECILDEKDSAGDELSDACNHHLWVYRNLLTKPESKEFLSLAPPDCADEFRNVASKNCSNDLSLTCVIDNKDSLSHEPCKSLVTRIEKVMFGDYHLMERFAAKCRTDIGKYMCGRNERSPAEGSIKLPHSQGRTIECLSEHVQNLTADCAMEILRIAELQVDDFHLDRALYFACRDDRENFCHRIRAGNGRVYKCLVKNQRDDRMSEKCRDQIQRRQKLGWQDYKASGIVMSCKAEIRKFKCRREASSTDKVVRLSKILLCLENAAHMKHEINSECVKEIHQHRRALMEDFKITPELLSACANEYRNYCSSKTSSKNSIHCLMDLARSQNNERKLGSNCKARLEDFLKITDVADDWRVDPVLEQNCSPFAERYCASMPVNKVLDCLMDTLANDATIGDAPIPNAGECINTLLQIQYFVARDFPMDSALFDACSRDAEKICGASAEWSPDPNSHEPSRGPMILSCLFRNINADKPLRAVTPLCAEKVKETMRRRALSVRLMPEIEEACLTYLADLCPNKQKPGEELSCLQDHFEELKGDCSLAVGNFTEIEMKNPTMNPYLYKYCRDVIENQCADDKSDDSDMVECLIEKKPDIKSKKCRATIEHMQIIRVKHFNFTPKFKMHCQEPVMRWCKTERMTAASLVSCLSEHIRNDTVNELNHRITKPCRKQVRNLIYSKIQLENGRLDPHSMYSLCRGSIQKLCGDVKKGGGRIFGCLTSLDNRDILRRDDPTCFEALVKLQQDVNSYGTLDLNLQSVCNQEIKMFCGNQQENIFPCLLANSLHETNSKKFSGDCERAVRVRQIEQNSDLRLNPRLRTACKMDIPKYCSSVKYGDGHTLECLKRHITDNNGQVLTDSCRDHLISIMESAAQVDVKIDSALYVACKEDIRECQYGALGDADKGDGGYVEDCLKRLFHEKKLKFDSCKSQVKQLIQATLVDIHVDPALNQACYMDLIKRCNDVPPGGSRKISCLLELLEEEKSKNIVKLSEKCRKVLAVRAEMFAEVESAKFESLQDIYQHVQKSKNKSYFMIVAVSIVGLIFIFGLYCGRATKRRTELKDK